MNMGPVNQERFCESTIQADIHSKIQQYPTTLACYQKWPTGGARTHTDVSV